MPSRGGGLYCGPLRLLALEAFEKLNNAGAATNLRTGQEIREVPDASHVSSTIEMVNLDKRYDVVVIDEIQMIADKVRGDNWYVDASIDISNLCVLMYYFDTCSQDEDRAWRPGFGDTSVWWRGGPASSAETVGIHKRDLGDYSIRAPNPARVSRTLVVGR